jgi:hypothetical protein
MNMIAEDTLKALLARRTELKNLDYKALMNWATASNEEKCELVKDILAMMNTQDGGQIIIGVEDKTCDTIGLTEADFTSFDPTKVNDFVRKYTDPPAFCEVQKFALDGKKFVVIDVLEFTDVPIICKADANSSANKPILKRGGVYIRTDKPSSELVSSAEEMRELMGRALLKRGDQLLRTIQGLMSGRPITPQDELDKYRQELEDTERFFSQVLPGDVQSGGHWDVIAMPSNFAIERVPNLGTLASALEASQVSLRGWNFPHIDPRNARNFSQGRQSFTAWNKGEMRCYEALRAYTSGLFIWTGTYWDDAPVFGGAGARVLSWVSLIYQITEFFLFLSRYYARIVEDATLTVRIRLNDTNGRVLVSRGDAGPLLDNYVCSEDKIEVSGEYSVSQLRVSPEDVARPVIRRVFEIFQWTNVKDDLIRQYQLRLIERHF